MSATKTYDYQTIDHDGKRTKGKIEASNELAAAQLLRQQGLTPLAITNADTLMKRDIRVPGFGDRTTLKDLSVFARQFATMTQSGMSLLRSLSVLEDQAPKPSLKKALSEVRLDIEGGTSLSGALGKHPKVFPTLMVAMIRAGETGGFLDSALDRIATNFEKDAALRGKIKSALTYPVIVLVFTAVMISAVLIFIVPIFEKMFKQLGGQLPLPTQIIVTASHTLFWLGPVLIIGGIVITVGLRQLMSNNPAVRLWFDKVKLKLPVFGPLFTKIALSRFSRNLGTLLGVGVPVLQALDVVGATTGNSVITAAMNDLQSAVREGQPMSSQLHAHKIFPSMIVQMVEVGEESGQISQMLEKVADFLRQRGRQRGRSTHRVHRTDHGARHGRRGRRNDRLPLPADVLDLPEHPEQLMRPQPIDRQLTARTEPQQPFRTALRTDAATHGRANGRSDQFHLKPQP